jgi:hypothetical protein
MSSSTLTTIENVLTLYGNPIFLTLGNIGNIFIVIIFSRQHQSACAIYLTSSGIMNSLYLTFGGISSMVIFYYPDRTMRIMAFCKIYAFIVNIIGQIPKSMIIFACIDRFLITSNRAGFRAFSTPKRAKYFIFFSIIFWVVLAIPAPLMTSVVNGQCISSGVFSVIYSVDSILFIGFIPTIVSAIFGYLTYRNMRQLKNRIQPVAQNTINTNVTIQRRDHDLLIIVIAEIFVYVVTTALFPLIQLEMMITRYVMPNKSFQYFQIEIFVLNIAYFLLSINSAAPFYTYLISSKSFRREFKQLIINTYWKLTNQTAIETISKTDRTLTQRETRI